MGDNMSKIKFNNNQKECLIEDETNNLETEFEKITSEYENLNIGDIIFAKRYTSEEDMLKIPEGHREGPYLVVGKYNSMPICLYISGNPPKNKFFSHKTLELNNKNYFLNKCSYVHITNRSYISKDRYIEKIDYLTEEDKRILFKKHEIIQRTNKYSRIKLDLPTIPLEPGDIITYGYDFYLIIAEINNKYHCIKMSKEKFESEFYIVIEGEKYYLDFDNPIIYSKLLEPLRENFIDNRILHNVLAIQRQRIEYLKHKYKISRGSLIRINDIFYYVYGEIGNEWLAFSVTNQESDVLCPLTIGNEFYYTDFSNNTTIPKNTEGIEVINLANDKEMKNIKDSKKSYKKNFQKKELKKQKSQIINSSDNQKIKKPEIESGCLVKIANTDSNTIYLYLVIIRDQDEIITIRYDKYLQGEYTLNKFYIEQIEKYSTSKNFNLKQVLTDIKEIAKGYINKERLKKLINSLENENFNNDTESQTQQVPKLIKKLTPQNPNDTQGGIHE